MIDHGLLSLLRQLRGRLEHQPFASARDRALVARINRLITARLPPAGAIEGAARRQSALVANISIDPGERRLRAHPLGTEIGCWYLVRHHKDAFWQERATAGHGSRDARQAGLPALTGKILYLRFSRGFDGSEIAFILGLSRRTVRAHLRRALLARR